MLALLLPILFVSGYAYGQSDLAPVDLFAAANLGTDQARHSLRPFWETWTLLHKEYFDQPLDDDKLIEGAISGMLDTLEDPNTRYLTPAQEEAARQAARGQLEGIGLEVTGEGGAIRVIAPYDGSPAAAAGLRAGDILREADGIPLTGLPAHEAATLVRGPAGTDVRLLIDRDGELFEVEVTRDVIHVPSARGEVLAEGIAYIRLSRFIDTTAGELEELLEDLLARSPPGLILDLRSNPGGSLPAAVDVADQFLDSGPILIERFGSGRENVFRSEAPGTAQDIPLIVLIDQGSASASEVLSGAIRDRQRGILVGQTSFGKGTVQTWKRLSNGGGVRITVARWLTPNGTWVHERGLEPDIAVALPERNGAGFSDTQLQTAVDYLLEQLVTETPDDELD